MTDGGVNAHETHHPTSALIMTAEQALIRDRGEEGCKESVKGGERERERARWERENVQKDEERD